ncbi:HypC/HybG/HupF family hydrogenase formation chaperone [Escherichia coli]|uniref:HypC/HybG/HupF family hydrogenase formation chaperone n=1 Tax=Escherichia coli TaxID=562 RepID=UPI00098CEBC7|nr:HypC/HybG/HupF family hydrogenase formation chaperone [Escherichia coli]EEX9039605.1 HypC/HybG/HupF family hydrogenase formation chaperone [Escherichia coli]EFJ8039232.1 HypC/HybG/HupF family hydrogenase formation chaperone [Escherichia coli]EJS2621885.1 HypC/HybG/HupF family hydrogenase formation chaperone [Escherichia coli]EKE5038052.1 HypC/HybG/HupF family hydrogenase formation chaperone [Escherichia coli]
MCVGIPVKVVQSGKWYCNCLDYSGNIIDVDITLVGDVDVNEWLLISNGTAYRRICEREAMEILHVLSMLN